MFGHLIVVENYGFWNSSIDPPQLEHRRWLAHSLPHAHAIAERARPCTNVKVSSYACTCNCPCTSIHARARACTLQLKRRTKKCIYIYIYIYISVGPFRGHQAEGDMFQSSKLTSSNQFNLTVYVLSITSILYLTVS